MIRSDPFGHPKTGYPRKTKASAHAATDVSERGIASIHLDGWSISDRENVVATTRVL
jgi:hypothetical protein